MVEPQLSKLCLRPSSPCWAGLSNPCGMASAGGALMTPLINFMSEWWGKGWQEAARAPQDWWCVLQVQALHGWPWVGIAFPAPGGAGHAQGTRGSWAENFQGLCHHLCQGRHCWAFIICEDEVAPLENLSWDISLSKRLVQCLSVCILSGLKKGLVGSFKGCFWGVVCCSDILTGLKCNLISP